jgi:integrase
MSPLRDALTHYVATRRALGAQLREPAVSLGHFVEFLEHEGAEFITIDLALRWATAPTGVQRATWARRLTAVRRFATWLSATDARTQVPPPRLVDSRRPRHEPHIFTDEELRQLMAAASRLSSPKGLRAQTYTTLLGLLATTGLRPGEALALQRSDVDLDRGILFIRDTKFGKSRFVPLHESTRAALAGYARRRDALSVREPTTFFVSEQKRPLQSCTARRTFARLSCAVGIRPIAGRRRAGRGPRLQDVRHSFATRTLVAWYRAGLDVERELPKLSTYLGHVDVVSTYWYISAVPELLQLATDRLCQRPQGGAS